MLLNNSQIDITDEICPMTFVRAKVELEKIAVGGVLSIKLRGGEPIHNVPRAMLDHGHEILSTKELADDLFEIVVKKKR